MTADYAEKEREFLASLEADTGRNLEAWMAAIETQGLTERNAIIDWLRGQGFLFSKASWLERIHHNSGKPIYGAGGGAGPRRQASEIKARAEFAHRGRRSRSGCPGPRSRAAGRASETGHARARRASCHRKGVPPAGCLRAG
jgi:hypothetical protein